MYVCVYLCIYVYTRICMYVLCMYLSIYVHMYFCVCVCVCACACTHACLCMCMCICIHACKQVCMYDCKNICVCAESLSVVVIYCQYLIVFWKGSHWPCMFIFLHGTQILLKNHKVYQENWLTFWKCSIVRGKNGPTCIKHGRCARMMTICNIFLNFVEWLYHSTL